MRTPIIICAFIIVTMITVAIFTFGTGGSDLKKDKTTELGNKIDDDIPTNDIQISRKWEMPEILKEVSAIAYVDAQRFACVQDELGKIFIFNTTTKKIEKEIEFGGTGDYEGIAVNGQNAYVLKANGTIIEIRNYNGKPDVQEYETQLTKKQDTEGLTLDKHNNRLLISVKAKDPNSDDYKGIYSFDLKKKELQTDPVFKIDLQDNVFGGSKSGKKKGSIMDPSEIAINPQTGEIYILDGGNPKLLIMDKSSNIVSLLTLDKKEFSQPEGMSFSPDGKLYISNEGVNEPGNILEVEK